MVASWKRALRPAARAYQMTARLSGVDPIRAVQSLRNIPRAFGELVRYRELAMSSKFPLSLRDVALIVSDYGDSAGEASGHYFHMDLWAARKIHARRPREHFDVGSRIDGFIAHVLTFMPVTVLDIRPLESKIEGLRFVRGDATDLASFADGSIDSISSLHAVEHFGLGRYGDPIDPDACFKAMASLARVLAPGGRLYFAVPIGRERVEFNAHRVFSPSTIVQAFSALDVVSFSAVDDRGDFVAVADTRGWDDAEYSCGLFEFGK